MPDHFVHFGVRVLAIIDLAIFLTWSLAWYNVKNNFICFGKNQTHIDHAVASYSEDNVIKYSHNEKIPPSATNGGVDHDGISAPGIAAITAGAAVAIIFILGYIFLEIWLCWTLYRAALEREKSLCTKWLCWRVLLLAALFVVMIAGAAGTTCLHLSQMLYVGFRIFSIIAVSEYRRSISADQIETNIRQCRSPDKIRLETDFY